MSYRRAEEAAPLRGAASMTVCTNDLALCNLVEHVGPVAVRQTLRNPKLLVSQVVELEDDRIVLSAVGAGMLPQESDEILGPFFDHRFLPLPGEGDVALLVRQIVLAMLGRPAGPAVVIELPTRPPPPGKFLCWLLPFAALTPPHDRSIRRRTDVPIGTAPANPSK
ncbi:MAG TPA: ATP-binding protein [Solirubrobacterales bacterium]|nr:ATP-binding protein [Solirubrobacterales bacterium]